MKPGRTSVCVELCASIHPKMGKLSRSSGRGGAYLVGRPSSAGGGRGGGGGGGRVRRYVRLAGHDKFTAWLTICPPPGSFWHRTSRPPLEEGRRGGKEGGSMQTRRLLFKLNAATSEEDDSLPGPLELPFISRRIGGGETAFIEDERFF